MQAMVCSRNALFILCLTAWLGASGCTPAPPATARFAPLIEELHALLGDVISSREQGKPAGEPVRVDFVPATPRTESIGQRILVLDEGMLLAGTTRYRERVLAHIEMNREGFYTEYHPSVSIPAPLATLFSRLDDYPEFVPAAVLQPLQEPFLQAFRGAIPSGYWEGHGNPIFASLAELNPNAQFVVGQNRLKDLWAVPAFCDLLSGDDTARNAVLSRLAERYDNAARSLGQLVEKYSIRYINASWGADSRSTSASVAALCGATPTPQIIGNLLELDRGYMHALSTLRSSDCLGSERTQVIVVQAGVSVSPRLLGGGDPDYPIDCDSSIRNRLRVASFTSLSEDIPYIGSGDSTYLSSAAVNAAPCVDAFINLGYEDGFVGERAERRRQLRDTPFGIGWGPHVWPPSSSFAAPVALSYLIFLQEQTDKPLQSEQLLWRATHGGTFYILDPIQHQRFSLVELGYPGLTP